MTMSVVLMGVVALAATVFWVYRRREATRTAAEVLGRSPVVGCTGTVACERMAVDGEGQVRVVDRRGKVWPLAARLVDADGPLPEGAEVLVIEGPRGSRPALVVPNDLPGLEYVE